MRVYVVCHNLSGKRAGELCTFSGEVEFETVNSFAVCPVCGGLLTLDDAEAGDEDGN